MVIRNIYEVNKLGQIVITLPQNLRNRKKLSVTVEDLNEDRAEKLELLKRATNDPLFQEDCNEITSDFKNADDEI